ncbi:siderophore-iron reductase FhuF [Castellaniella sp.]|jgi:ferric iron reductase protein FhuF|uniref:siderophore-iron reductase FhuF n=1 Tax=Castellaniella sp. TaxID=1955812 RepID=UPI003A933C5C
MQATRLIQKLQEDAALAPLLPLLMSGQQDGLWLTARELQQPETLAPLLKDFSTEEGWPGGDGRAIASLWSRWHFAAVLSPWVAALLLHRHTPVLQAIQLSPQHKTCGVAWEPVVPALEPASAQTACGQIVQQMQPLIESLHKVSRTSPRVFWSNLGNLLEYLVQQLREHPGASPKVLQAFENLLTLPALSDGNPNPLQQPVRDVPVSAADTGCTHRVRKICCLYYLLPGTSLCENCPRPAPTHHHV